MGRVIKRSDVDDIGRRNNNIDSFKNRNFDGKRSTVDAYTHKKVFYSSQNYFTTRTTANVDHIVPIDSLINEYRGVIGRQDLKSIVNADFNLAVTSEALNKSKSNLNNHEYLLKKFKSGNPQDLETTINMLRAEGHAKVSVKMNVAEIKAKKIAEELERIPPKSIKPLTSVAKKSLGRGAEASLIALQVSTLENLAMVTMGKKDLKTATNDIANDTIKSGVSQVAMDSAQQLVINLASKANSKELAKLLSKDLPVAEAAVAIMVANTTMQYLNGEISAEDCAIEIMLQGAGSFVQAACMATGQIALAVVVSLIMTKVSGTILKYQQEQKLNAEREAALNRVVAKAMSELDRQRKSLIQQIDEENEKYTEAYTDGFELIYLSVLNNDDKGLTNGLNCILSVMNKSCKFETQDAFDVFFDNKDAVLTI